MFVAMIKVVLSAFECMQQTLLSDNIFKAKHIGMIRVNCLVQLGLTACA